MEVMGIPYPPFIDEARDREILWRAATVYDGFSIQTSLPWWDSRVPPLVYYGDAAPGRQWEGTYSDSLTQAMIQFANDNELYQWRIIPSTMQQQITATNGRGLLLGSASLPASLATSVAGQVGTFTVTGMNNAGRIVGFTNPPYNPEAPLPNTGFATGTGGDLSLGTFLPQCINSFGEMAGYADHDSWTKQPEIMLPGGTSTTAMPILPGYEFYGGYPTAINDDELILGSTGDPSEAHDGSAWICKGGVIYNLDDRVPPEAGIHFSIAGVLSNNSFATAFSSAYQNYLLVPPGLYPDANRDGVITLPGASTANGPRLDATTQSKPFILPVPADQSLETLVLGADALPDLQRLWIDMRGMESRLANDPDIMVYLEWIPQPAVQWNSGTGNPEVVLYKAADPAGSADYLTDSSRAAAQTSAQYNQPLAVIAPGQPYALDRSMVEDLAGSPTLHFLFRPLTGGFGRLILSFVKNGAEIGEGSPLWTYVMPVRIQVQQTQINETSALLKAAVTVQTFDPAGSAWSPIGDGSVLNWTVTAGQPSQQQTIVSGGGASLLVTHSAGAHAVVQTELTHLVTPNLTLDVAEPNVVTTIGGSLRISELDDMAGPSCRRVALNGRAIPEPIAGQKVESETEGEETYIDALSLRPRHAVSDLYVPIPNSELSLSVRRVWDSEAWNERSGLRSAERLDRPFGAGWASNLTPHIRLAYQRPIEQGALVSADYAYVTDEEGSSFRFVILHQNDAQGNPMPGDSYIALPSSTIDQAAYLATLVSDGNGGYTFTKERGITSIQTIAALRGGRAGCRGRRRKQPA